MFHAFTVQPFCPISAWKAVFNIGRWAIEYKVGIFPATVETSFRDSREKTWKNIAKHIGECLAHSTWEASCTSKRKWERVCWMKERGILVKDSSSVELLGPGSASKGNPTFVLLWNDGGRHSGRCRRVLKDGVRLHQLPRYKSCSLICMEMSTEKIMYYKHECTSILFFYSRGEKWCLINEEQRREVKCFSINFPVCNGTNNKRWQW